MVVHEGRVYDGHDLDITQRPERLKQDPRATVWDDQIAVLDVLLKDDEVVDLNDETWIGPQLCEPVWAIGASADLEQHSRDLRCDEQSIELWAVEHPDQLFELCRADGYDAVNLLSYINFFYHFISKLLNLFIDRY